MIIGSGSSTGTSGSTQSTGGSVTMPSASSPQHAELNTNWSTLKSDIQLYNLKGHPVFLNTYGEKLPPGWSVSRVKSFVGAGGIWMDWCGWPMYASGSSVFFNMARSMGVNIPGGTFIQPGGTGKYPRSLIINQPISAGNFIVNNYAAHAYFNNSNPSGGSWFASFGILYGRGAYLYAYGNDDQRYGIGLGTILGAYQNPGVSEYNYSAFLADTLNRLPNISYSGPSTNPQPAPAPSQGSGGGGTPIPVQSGSSGSSSGPPNLGSTGGTTNPTTPALPNGQNGQFLLLIGLGVAGYGVFKYGYNRGWF